MWDICVLFFNDTDDFILHFPRRKCEIYVWCFLLTLMILSHIFLRGNVRYIFAVFLMSLMILPHIFLGGNVRYIFAVFLMALMILSHIFLGENIRNDLDFSCVFYFSEKKNWMLLFKLLTWLSEQFGARELADSCRNETANLPTNMERKSYTAQNRRLLHCRCLVTF